MNIPYSFDVGQGATFRMDKFTINSISVGGLDEWIITPEDLDDSGRLLINYKYTNTSGSMSISYVKISLIFSGEAGSTSYTIKESSDTLHGHDSVSGSKYITIGLTDSRETIQLKVIAKPYNSDTKKTNTKTIDGLSWAYEMDVPTVTSFTAARTYSTSTTVQYTIKGSRVSSKVSNYQLLLEYSKNEWVTTYTVVLTSYIASFLSSSGYTGTLTNVAISDRLYMRITFRNLYETSSRETTVSQATACLHLAGNKDGGACFGGYSKSVAGNALLESYYKCEFYEGINAGGWNYSTSERACGKWIDGSTIYRKTIAVPTIARASDYTKYDLNIGTPIRTILRYEGFLDYNKDKGRRCFPYISSETASASLAQLSTSPGTTSTTVQLWHRDTATGGVQITGGYITIWYIK